MGGSSKIIDPGVEPISISLVGRLDFRTSRSGDTATASIQRALGFQYRYQPARLALGRSLGLTTPPAPVDNHDGRAIRGETLFGAGDDIGLWVSLIVAHAAQGPLSRRRFQDLVAAHWARGAGLIWDGLRGAGDPTADLARMLAGLRR